MATSDDINSWLISEGRELGSGFEVVDGYIKRLITAGVPISRANIAQRFANPLLVAWGVIWTSEGSTEYDVTHAMLETSSYVGSPFEYVLTKEKPLHKSLLNLDRETEHSSYLELADGGGTDLFANFLRYGDGSKNGCTYVTDIKNGFSQEHIDLIQNTRMGLASAMEPITMRRSTESLLRTYIGNDPAKSVTEGTTQRGQQTTLDAVVMITDLRGFTAKSEQWGERKLLEALNHYFDIVVSAVEKNGGDVLKFMGDGILSIFKIDDVTAEKAQCQNAANAAQMAMSNLEGLNKERAPSQEDALSMGIGINLGRVTYGNIGSPGRLDFTVLGPAVNVASRVQDLCKKIGEPVLVTKQVASQINGNCSNHGTHEIRGAKDPLEIFSLDTAHS